MATFIITLNQILKLMQDFQESHAMLNDFGYGQTADIGTSRQMEFPYMWVTHEQDSNIQIVNKQIVPSLNFTILFVDQINEQENYLNTNGENSNNGQEIISDTLQYAQDFITWILGIGRWSDYGLMINDENVSIYNLVDETDDKVNGWAMRLSLKLKHMNCEIPLR